MDFARWNFLPGMLFRSEGKWWAGGVRGRGHNGLDLRFYETGSGEARTLSEETKIPLLQTGRIIKIIPDFIGYSIFAGHERRDDGRRLLTIYGHMNPAAAIGNAKLAGGCAIGRLAGAKGPVPPHLHLSIALVPADISREALSWETLDAAAGVIFMDPEQLI